MTCARAIGEFERRARERSLRDRLWRAFWVEHHVYSPDDVPDVEEQCRDHAFACAAEELQRLAVEAEALGFEGDPVWAYTLMPATAECRGRNVTEVGARAPRR